MRKAHHIMPVYRRHILSRKKQWSRRRTELDGDARVPQRGARQLIHYRAFIDSYLKAKRAVCAGLELVDA